MSLVPTIPIAGTRTFRVDGTVVSVAVQGTGDIYRAATVEPITLPGRTGKLEVCGWGETFDEAVDHVLSRLKAYDVEEIMHQCPMCATFGRPLIGECRTCGGVGYCDADAASAARRHVEFLDGYQCIMRGCDDADVDLGEGGCDDA